MRFNHLILGAVLGVSTLLTGCGGDSSSTSGSSASSSASEKLTVRQKTTAADYNNAVQELYIAYFGRPADPTGLANIEAALLSVSAPTDLPSLSVAYNTNGSIKGLIDSFGTSTESLNLYGSGTTTTFVTAIFQHVLGRAPAAAGLSYWVNAIDNQGLSKPDAAISIMAGSLQNTTAAGLLDAQTIQNKVAVASTFTTDLGANASRYAGSAAAYTARQMLTQVSNATTVSGFQANINATIATLIAANKATLTLTAASSTSPVTTLGTFNGSLASCSLGSNTCLPATTATCMYESGVGVAPYISSLPYVTFQDPLGRTFVIYMVHDSAALTAGEQPDNNGFDVMSTSIYDNSVSLQEGQWYSHATKVGTVTVTAVGTNTLTFTYNNYLLTNISTVGNLTVNGTVQISCVPPAGT